MNTMPEKNDVEQLQRALLALKKMRQKLEAIEQARTEPIAIIGIGLRFPGGADSPESYWRLLHDGVDTITVTPSERWDADAYFDADPEARGKIRTRYGGYVNDIDRFDPHFFGISPREAQNMDPQQRLTLEVAWEALEDAGIVPESLAGSKTGVFVGIGLNDYQRLQAPNQAADPTLINTYLTSGNLLCITPNRISYTLDLRGPSLAIDTACSSSLVAIHQACYSLRSGESTLALAGGVNMLLSPALSISLTKFLAPDGKCKTFDARADGYVRGEGTAVIVLKPLSRALADNDRIYALIRGSAVNQDGFSSGLTVPNGVAQQAMLREALANAGAQPHQVEYVEAHGTGTALGDPIEANALGAVLGKGRPADKPLLVGSVKTNMGHLEAAAGIAGLIKVALSLKHGAIPASLHFETPNPHIPLAQLALDVPRTLTPWIVTEKTTLAGVSSFGVGGTNAHALLAAPPTLPVAPPPATGARVLSLSAKSEPALRDLARRYADFLPTQPPEAFADICFSANTGRTHFAHRLALVAGTSAELHDALRAAANGEQRNGVFSGNVEREAKPKIALLFTGQGAQYLGMGQQLYASEPVFRAALDQCAELLRPHFDKPLLDVIFNREQADAKLIDQTIYTQPALFAIEYALAQLWKSWGVEPTAVLGHSVGEYVAACLAGVFSLEDGLMLIAARGRAMQALPAGGTMAAVFASEARVREAIRPHAATVAIAALNEPEHTVISGDATAVESILANFEAQGVRVRRLIVSHAFHSPLMDPALDAFEQTARRVRYAAPTITLVANVSGRAWEPNAAPDAAYWRRHLREAVRFADGIEALREQGYTLFLEVGPAPVLSGMGSRCVPADAATWLPSLRSGHDERQQMLKSLAALYVHGVTVHWAALEYDQPRVRVSLPHYPFQRERYWFAPSTPRTPRAINAGHPLLGKPVRSPALSGTLFETAIGIEDVPFVDGHRVYGTMVLPATAYLEMALAAAQETFGTGAHSIKNMVIQEALTLPEAGQRNVQFILHPPNDGAATFQVYAAHATANEQDAALDWRLHASGVLEIARSAAPTTSIDTLLTAQQRCTTEMPTDSFYQTLDEMGLNYGADFRGITRLWRGEHAALANVQLPAAPAREASAYQIHPALLDACLQTAAAVLPSDDAAMMYLPIELAGLRVYGRPETEMWSYVTLQPSASIELATGTVHIFAHDGRLIIEIERIIFKRASRAALQQATRRATSTASEWLYEVAWQPKPLVAASQPDASGHWLIFADQGGIGAALATQLHARGAHTTLVIAGPTLKQIEPNVWQINPAAAADFRQLLAENLQAAHGPYSGVVHLWGCDLSAADATSAAQMQSVGSLLYLTQALASAAPTRLWVATHGAQPVTLDAAAQAAQAPVWGLARTIAREHSELQCVCVDLDPALTATNSAPLLAEILGSDGEDHVALRGDQRYVARLVHQAIAASTQGSENASVQLDISARGVLDNLILRPLTRRAPGPREVELRVRTTGLNFRDVLSAMGMYPGDAGALGHECVGTVVAVGAEVTDIQVGDDVLAIADGSFSTFVTTDANLVARKPKQLSCAEAATIPITFVTAYYALHTLAQMQPGERVLIHAAAGGVGLAAVQIARKVGAEIFATAGSPEKHAFLRSLGVQHIFSSRTLDFADEIAALTNGAGVDLVLNSLTDEFIPKSFAVLRDGGRFLEIGKRGIWSAEQVEQLGRNIGYWIIYVGDICKSDPALIGSILHTLIEGFDTGALQPLPMRAFPLSQAADAFRFMAQAKHIGKVVVTHETAPHDSFSADATYLITGGLGGLGLLAAQRIVERGGRNVALVGRSAPSASIATTIQALEQAGARVAVLQGDIANADDVTRILEKIDQTMPPLRGIIHAAGVLDDGVLLQQSWEQFAHALAPKIDGSWHLHTQTRARALDFFVLFSAGATLLGAPGQGNYTAANAFLDALAYQRRAEGLPALSINWGPWATVGMAAGMSARDQQRLAEQGLGIISPQQGLDTFQTLLRSGAAQVVVLPMRWDVFAQQFANGHVPSLFADLVRSAQPAAAERNTTTVKQDFLLRVAEAPPSRQRSLVLAQVREQVGHVLALDAARPVEPRQPLQELGLDSLMAVELRNAFGATIGRALPATLLFDYPTMDALADYIMHELPTKQPDPAPVLAQMEPQRESTMAELDELSDDEAEALLLAELSG